MKISVSIFTLIMALFFAGSRAFSQQEQPNTGPVPLGGHEKVALHYYKINFTREQQTILQEVEIEFIFSVDEEGVPTLEDIKGIEDEAILDSLHYTSQRLPPFQPRMQNGQSESSFYFLKLQFPKYSYIEYPHALQQYRTLRYEDFEYIQKSGDRVDVLIGGLVNSFLGSPADYLAFGGGMKMDLMYIGKKGTGGGLVMNFYGNRLKQEYPVNSPRQQNSAPPTLLMGLALSKILYEKEKEEFNLQLELNYAIQNVTARIGEYDPDWVQLKGFSPGVVGNYLFKIGKDKTSHYYGSPTIYNHYLNVHGAVRPVFFDLKEATGVMIEVGLAYRMGYHFISAYRIKPGFK